MPAMQRIRRAVSTWASPPSAAPRKKPCKHGQQMLTGATQAPDAPQTEQPTKQPAQPAPLFTNSQLQLLELVWQPATAPLIFYISGADGSGAAIQSQLPELDRQGIAVSALYVPPSNRQGWEGLTQATVRLLQAATQARNGPVVVLAESMGACLALRVALRAPRHVSKLVLLNSATAFGRALAGLPNAVASTGLLSLFPKALFNGAQAVMLPLLANPAAAAPGASDDLRRMMNMSAPSLLAETSSGAQRPKAETNPAAAADYRLRMMQTGDLAEEQLARVAVPTLLLCASKDRLFPSMQEGARLQKLIRGSRRMILQNSGHAALLESTVSVYQVLRRAHFLPGSAAAPAHGVESGNAASLTHARASNGASAVSPPELHHVAKPGQQPSDPAVRSPQAAHAAVHGTAGAAFVFQNNVDPAAAAQSKVGGVAARSSNGAAHTRGSSPASFAGDGTMHQDSSMPLPPVGTAGPASPNSSTAATHRPPAEASLNIGFVDDALERGTAQFRAWHDAVAPVTLGLEKVPPPAALGGRPLLFIGNHTQFGLYDLPVLFIEMYMRGYQLTGLAHPQHWNSPLGGFFETFGAVKASPMAAYRALRRGSNVLLFPGGGREVAKRKGEAYQLLWKEQVDFVRLAARCDAVIVPFAAVGADDAFDLFMDSDEVLAHPVLGPLTRYFMLSFGGADTDLNESVLPITNIPGTQIPSPVPLSNLGRVYFQFGDPLDTQALDPGDAEGCAALYAQCKQRVEGEISALLEVRERDPRNRGWDRLRGDVMDSLGLMSAAFNRATEGATAQTVQP